MTDVAKISPVLEARSGATISLRLGPMRVPVEGTWPTRSFTDPAMSIGGGVRFNVNEHLIVRPDIRALLVFAAGETHTLGVDGIQLGYRF